MAFDIYGVGNALVDIQARVDDQFLKLKPWLKFEPDSVCQIGTRSRFQYCFHSAAAFKNAESHGLSAQGIPLNGHDQLGLAVLEQPRREIAQFRKPAPGVGSETHLPSVAPVSRSGQAAAVQHVFAQKVESSAQARIGQCRFACAAAAYEGHCSTVAPHGGGVHRRTVAL